jgi:hypothetical protein
MAAGVRPLLVRTGYGRDTEAAGGLPEGSMVADDLAGAAETILAGGRRSGPDFS